MNQRSPIKEGRLKMTRHIMQSFVIEPESALRPNLPIETLFKTPIKITIAEIEDNRVTLSILADKRMKISREEFYTAETDRQKSLLYGEESDSIEQQRLLKVEIENVDKERRLLKLKQKKLNPKYNNEDRENHDYLNNRLEALLEYRNKIKNKLGELKEKIKQDNVAANGNRNHKYSMDFEHLFLKVAEEKLPEDEYNRLLQLTQHIMSEDAA